VLKKSLFILTIAASSYLAGCASVPMASTKEDNIKKQFSAPKNGTSGLYIYRNTSFGGALKKDVYIDGQLIGETAPMTYFYKSVNPGKHTLSTESEFSNNDLILQTESDKNYFINQYIKMGLFVGGAGLEQVSEQQGKKGVLECGLAK
jgi:uncharacterized protein DUF2846